MLFFIKIQNIFWGRSIIIILNVSLSMPLSVMVVKLQKSVITLISTRNLISISYLRVPSLAHFRPRIYGSYSGARWNFALNGDFTMKSSWWKSKIFDGHYFTIGSSWWNYRWEFGFIWFLKWLYIMTTGLGRYNESSSKWSHYYYYYKQNPIDIISSERMSRIWIGKLTASKWLM